MLYSLRYEKHSNNDIVGLINALERRGVSERLRKVRASPCWLHCVLLYNVHVTWHFSNLRVRGIMLDFCAHYCSLPKCRSFIQVRNGVRVHFEKVSKLRFRCIVNYEYCIIWDSFWQMIPAVLDYGGQKVRTSDLFGNDTPIAMTKKFFKGLKVCGFGFHCATWIKAKLSNVFLPTFRIHRLQPILMR